MYKITEQCIRQAVEVLFGGKTDKTDMIVYEHTAEYKPRTATHNYTQPRTAAYKRIDSRIQAIHNRIHAIYMRHIRG